MNHSLIDSKTILLVVSPERSSAFLLPICFCVFGVARDGDHLSVGIPFIVLPNPYSAGAASTVLARCPESSLATILKWAKIFF